jgi:hypothetical protein
MVTTATKLQVLDPTVDPIPADAVVAPRPETLNGTVVGLLSNNKLNADELLVMVQDVLADRYEFKGVVSRNKGLASRPCPEEILNELSEQCDVVITASGD